MDDIVAAAQQGPDHSGNIDWNDKKTESSENGLFGQWQALPGGVANGGKSSALALVLAQMQGREQGVQGSMQVVVDLKAFVEQPEQVQLTLMGLLLTGSTVEISLRDDVAAGE
ncbi:hypothetical protein [Streptomyces sp. NPDC086989]|uniref:hypothetical protein n=1 Tax=Streptomyces sp. NPDC086989 TaxID=3365764 RepID=UPI00380F3A46